MDSMDMFSVVFEGITYNLKLDKTLFVLSALEGRKIKFNNKEQVESLMKHYCLFDKHFLNNINRLKIESK